MKKRYFSIILACLFIGVMALHSTKVSAATDAVATREGIDVSGKSGDIDWDKVKASGKTFVFLRCGYRGPNDDELCKDSFFVENLKGALDAGLDVGVYYATQAITTKEAVEEADETLKMVKSALSQNSSYELTLPIMIDFEEETDSKFRLAKANLSKEEHNAIANAFCARIEANGFTAGIYAGKNMLANKFIESKLTSKYTLWYAAWNNTLDNSSATFWQYSGNVKLNGVQYYADLNRQYIRTPAKVSSLTTKVNSKLQVSLSWPKVTGVYGYQIYRTSSKTNKETLLATVKGAAKTSYTDTSTEKNVTYTYRVRAMQKTSTKNYYGSFSSKVSNYINSYKITLNTNSGAIKSGNVSSYVYGIGATLPTNIVRKGYLFGGWYTDKAFTSSKITKISTTAKGNKTLYAKWIKVSVAKPVIKSVTNVKTKKAVVTLKSKVSGAAGYEIRYSLKSTMASAKTVTITNGTTLTKTISSLTKGKTYYFQVRAYRYDSTGSKVYSSYSAKKSVKISK